MQGRRLPPFGFCFLIVAVGTTLLTTSCMGQPRTPPLAARSVVARPIEIRITSASVDSLTLVSEFTNLTEYDVYLEAADWEFTVGPVEGILGQRGGSRPDLLGGVEVTPSPCSPTRLEPGERYLSVLRIQPSLQAVQDRLLRLSVVRRVTLVSAQCRSRRVFVERYTGLVAVAR